MIRHENVLFKVRGKHKDLLATLLLHPNELVGLKKVSHLGSFIASLQIGNAGGQPRGRLCCSP